jgi:hypothetical protein
VSSNKLSQRFPASFFCIVIISGPLFINLNSFFMQTANIKRVFRSLTVLAFSAAFFSFVKPAGGEGFEIFLNSKVVVQRFGGDKNTVQTLYLGQASAKDQLTVKYYHCGRAGKSRVIALKNEKNKIVKEWSYADNAASAGMTLPVKDILDVLKISGDEKLSLHYNSSELTNGRKLAVISKAHSNIASL